MMFVTENQRAYSKGTNMLSILNTSLKRTLILGVMEATEDKRAQQG